MAESKEAVKIEDLRDLDDEWKTVMEKVIKSQESISPSEIPKSPLKSEKTEPNNNLNSPKIGKLISGRKRNWSEVMKHTTKSSSRRDVCSSFPAKKSVRPIEDSSKKTVNKVTPRRLSTGNRIGGLSDMDLNDRLHLRKVQIERKSKAEQSRVILENLQSGRSSTVETGIDRTLPTLRKIIPRSQSTIEGKKIVLKLVEI